MLAEQPVSCPPVEMVLLTTNSEKNAMVDPDATPNARDFAEMARSKLEKSATMESSTAI